MKQLLLITLMMAALFDCSRKNRIAGTADDVNSGSLFGQLMTEKGTTIDDTVMVCLYEEDAYEGLAKARSGGKEPLRTLLSRNGAYEFDSLLAGMYRIEVTKDSIVVGEQRGIALRRGEDKEVNITIVIIINQTFNIWTDQRQHITINNFYIDNGKVMKTDSGYVLSFAQTDTVVFEIAVEKDGKPGVVKVRIIRHADGTTTFEMIEGSDEVTVRPGAKGHLGDVAIDLRAPGTLDVESTFDTSAVPSKSE